jgi:sulfite reductase beta subunit-like hemoprotein
LLLKEQLGLLTDEERERLLHLKDHFARLEEEEMRRREMEEELRRKEMEEELRRSEMDELEMLRLKLLNGTITEEELRRLRELEAKYGLEAIANPFEP